MERGVVADMKSQRWGSCRRTASPTHPSPLEGEGEGGGAVGLRSALGPSLAAPPARWVGGGDGRDPAAGGGAPTHATLSISKSHGHELGRRGKEKELWAAPYRGRSQSKEM